MTGGDFLKKGRLLILCIVPLFVISLFLGYNLLQIQKNRVANEDVEIKYLQIWGAVPEDAGPDEVIKDFNEEYESKGIQAKYNYYVNNDAGNKKMESALLAGGSVDIYFSYDTSRLEKRIVSDMALDLTEYIKRDRIDMGAYFGNYVYSYYVDSKPYSIPTKLDQYGITINKDMFDEAGIKVPTEWDYEEFREIAKRLTKGTGTNKRYGMFFCTQQDINYAITFIAPRSLGGDPLYKKEGKTSNFDDEVLYQVVNLVNTMMNVDGSAPSHMDSVTQKLTQESMFLTEKSAMTIGPWIIRSVKDQETYPHDFVTAFVPYPVADKSIPNYDQGGLGDHLSICPKTKYKKEAWEFVKWYATKGMLPVVEGGRIPAYKGFAPNTITDLLLKGTEGNIDPVSAKEVLIISKENYAIPSFSNKLSDLNKIMAEEFEQIITRKTTVSQGLENAKKLGDEVLSAN